MFWDGLRKAIKAIKKICHKKRKTHISSRLVPNGALLLLTLPSMGLRQWWTWANSVFNTASIYSKSLQCWCLSISSSFCSLRFASVVRSLKSHSVWAYGVAFYSHLRVFSRSSISSFSCHFCTSASYPGKVLPYPMYLYSIDSVLCPTRCNTITCPSVMKMVQRADVFLLF